MSGSSAAWKPTPCAMASRSLAASRCALLAALAARRGARPPQTRAAASPRHGRPCRSHLHRALTSTRTARQGAASHQGRSGTLARSRLPRPQRLLHTMCTGGSQARGPTGTCCKPGRAPSAGLARCAMRSPTHPAAGPASSRPAALAAPARACTAARPPYSGTALPVSFCTSPLRRACCPSSARFWAASAGALPVLAWQHGGAGTGGRAARRLGARLQVGQQTRELAHVGQRAVPAQAAAAGRHHAVPHAQRLLRAPPSS